MEICKYKFTLFLTVCLPILAGLDGRDIEFVVGGMDRSFREPDFYCLDFNQVSAHENSVDKILESFLQNDPYFPRPGSPLWGPFKAAYLAEAGKGPSGVEAEKLAQEVVEKIETAVEAKGAVVVPEGRGLEMGDHEVCVVNRNRLQVVRQGKLVQDFQMCCSVHACVPVQL